MESKDHQRGHNKHYDAGDAFEKEAQEGFDLLGLTESEALKKNLDRRFQAEVMKKDHKSRNFTWAAAAALFICAGLVVYFVLPSEKKEVAIHNTSIEKQFEPNNKTDLSNEQTEKSKVSNVPATPATKIVVAQKSNNEVVEKKSFQNKPAALTEAQVADDVKSPKTEMDEEKLAAEKKNAASEDFAAATNIQASQNINLASPNGASAPVAYQAAQASPVSTYPVQTISKKSQAAPRELATKALVSCYYKFGADSLQKNIKHLLQKAGIEKKFEAELMIRKNGSVASAKLMGYSAASADINSKIEIELLKLKGFVVEGSVSKNTLTNFNLKYTP